MSRAPRIYISAGEPSGDAHAAAVVTALKRRLPEASVEAFGGPGLEAAGAAVLDRMEHFSVVGFVEALWKLPAHLRLLGRVRLALRARRYDLVILVDYPGYHLRVAAEAAAAGIPVLYYIAPQMWAWRPVGCEGWPRCDGSRSFCRSKKRSFASAASRRRSWDIRSRIGHRRPRGRTPGAVSDSTLRGRCSASSRGAAHRR